MSIVQAFFNSKSNEFISEPLLYVFTYNTNFIKIMLWWDKTVIKSILYYFISFTESTTNSRENVV